MLGMRQLELGTAQGARNAPRAAATHCGNAGAGASTRKRLAPRNGAHRAARASRAQACNMCNAAKDGLMSVKGAEGGTTRAGAGGGFREVDDEEEARRKRRAIEDVRVRRARALFSLSMPPRRRACR